MAGAPGVGGAARRGEGGGVGGRRQRDEAVGEVGEVPGARAGRGRVEVDDRDRHALAEDEVVRREVVVADDLGGLARRQAPVRGGRIEAGGRVVEAAQERGGGRQD